MTTILVIYILYRILKAIKKKPAKKAGYTLPRSQTNYAIQNQINRLNRQKQIEYRQQERLIQQQRKRQQQEEIAENDLQFYIERVNQLYPLLWSLDSDIEYLEKQIKIDYKLNKTERAEKREKEKEKLIKKRIALESQIHATNNKIDKVKYILNRVA